MRRPHMKRRRLLVLPLSRLFPNIVTLGGLCCGLSAVRFAIENRFELAVILLVASAIIDGMDGRIARLLNSTSNFGAQLDSLSDFVCFGTAPVIVLYLWRLHELHNVGWALVLFFTMCCALRLARFNTSLLDETREPWQNKFFVGIPSPAGAMLALLPLVTSFYAGDEFLGNRYLVAVWVALVAILMPSRVPTFAAKRIRIHHEWVLPIMLLCGTMLVMVMIEPWQMFTLCGVLYCATIPMSLQKYRRLAAIHRTGEPSSPAATSSE